MFPSKFETKVTNYASNIQNIKDENQNAKQVNNNLKRKLSTSAKSRKRLVFGDITNASERKNEESPKAKKIVKKEVKEVEKKPPKELKKEEPAPVASTSAPVASTSALPKKSPEKKRKSDTYLIQTRGCDPTSKSFNRLYKDVDSFNKNNKLDNDVVDYDKENMHRLETVSDYAMDIFNYYKTREDKYTIKPYMSRQRKLAVWMRALLIDWMASVQQLLEENHETLYLSVKLVDSYLSKIPVDKSRLQLIGAAALLIACKYDERIPPLCYDLLYLCDGAYARFELLKMEKHILRVVNFDLGFPISYRFLRRFARGAKICMSTLTLARYILELSLMDYTVIRYKDSKLAAAALYVALRMQKTPDWTPALKFYTGYTVPEFYSEAMFLNKNLNKKKDENMMSITKKYSGEVFFEVALMKPIKKLVI